MSRDWQGGRWASVLLVVAAACAAAASLSGQEEPGTPPAPTVAAGRSPSVSTPGQVVAGRVTSAADGHPIAHATVSLSRQQQQRNGRRQSGGPNGAGATAQTDAAGRYAFAPQPAGRYTLRASAPGYLASLYLEHRGFSSAVVTDGGVATDDLRFALLPEASLHGRVLDDTGEPVHASITVYRDWAGEVATGNQPVGGTATQIRPAGGTTTDDDGRYEVGNLRPGRYYVAATATPWYAVHARTQPNEDRMPYRTAIDPALDVAYPVTFYPHAVTEGEAVPIALKAGQQAAANMTLQAEQAVTITVQMPPANTAAPGDAQRFPMLFQTVFGNDRGGGASVGGRVGDTVVLSGIAPGHYVVRSFGRGGPAGAETPVDVSAGPGAVTVLPVGTEAAGEVNLTLVTPAGTPVADAIAVELQRIGAGRGGGGSAPESATVTAGAAHFAHLQPGEYRVRVSKGEAAWVVSRVTVSGRAVPSRLLRVDGGTVQGEVVVSEYAPEVDGTVRAPDGKVYAGALVVLVPAGAKTEQDLFRADQSDLDGGYQFNGVVPGDYLLVAIEGGAELGWQSLPALMPYLAHAVPVTVPASGPRVVTLTEAAIVQQK